jgi:hypothetical protein
MDEYTEEWGGGGGGGVAWGLVWFEEWEFI